MAAFRISGAQLPNFIRYSTASPRDLSASIRAASGDNAAKVRREPPFPARPMQQKTPADGRGIPLQKPAQWSSLPPFPQKKQVDDDLETYFPSIIFLLRTESRKSRL
jgi:hypothetical protein